MQSRIIRCGLVLGCAAACFITGFAQEEVPVADSDTVQTDLVEETGRRLVQLDVTVSGPKGAIADLTGEDFELSVGARPVTSFTVDNLCHLPDGETPVEQAPEAVEPEPSATLLTTRPPVSYLFYFEQNNLTVQGRVRSLDMARELIDELIVGGNRGMVISSGRDLKTFVDLTDDKSALLGGIDTLEQDQQHWWDPTVESEDYRVGQVLDRLGEDATAAESMARLFRMEERWRTEKSLQLFSLVLGRMADLNAPKAAIYFADTIRANAGDHYMSLFASTGGNAVTREGFTAAHAFDEVVESASAQGIRIYSVQAQGLVTETSVAYAAGGNTRRFRDAENALVGLAAETGGVHFLRGQKTTRIAADIRSDLRCLYLISFDPVGYRTDASLPVGLRVLRPGVKAKARGLVVVQSETKRLRSRLLAAFAAGDGGESLVALNGSVIPTGFEKGKYSALVQLHVPGSPMFATTWDMGLSLVSRGAVREDASGRVSVSGPGIPVVFETQMTFSPGPYEVVSVAHEQTGDDVLTHRIDGEWPDADDAPASLGPIAVLQPEVGAFLRDTVLRRDGSLALGENGVARPDRPTALVSIICRGRTQKRPFVVERHLVGESAVEFEPQELDLGEDRCAVFQDIIKAGTMTDGGFEYKVQVMRDEEELASATREFLVAADATSAPSGP